jgi:hypothetical protein
MNINRNIKLLLLKLNQQGENVTLIQEQRYSEQFNNIYSRYKLTFWRQEKKRNRKGEEKIVNVPDTQEFTNSVELLKYMVVRANERKAVK